MTRGPWVRSAGRGLAVALLVYLAACEPSGPGPLTATVQAPGPTGALVVEVTGAGITGFEGVGDVRTLEAAPQGPAPAAGPVTRRIVVLSPSGLALRFNVKVADVSAPLPVAVVVSAVDTSNKPITSLTGYSIRIAR